MFFLKQNWKLSHKTKQNYIFLLKYSTLSFQRYTMVFSGVGAVFFLLLLCVKSNLKLQSQINHIPCKHKSFQNKLTYEK